MALQEEVENKTINFCISTTKLTARTLLKGANALIRLYQKKSSEGKQSVKHLLRQNRGVTKVDIAETSIKDFEKVAKKYGLDFAIRKDRTEEPPRYYVFFKSPDQDAFKAAFKEYSNIVVHKGREERPSVLKKLQELAHSVADLPDKVRNKDLGGLDR